jgi:hypothetical protein
MKTLRMPVFLNDRRHTYDLDYFLKGGIERREGPWRRRLITDRRSGKDRRKAMHTLDYRGPERRSGLERRSGINRRKT